MITAQKIELRKNKKKDNKVLFYIQSAVSNEIFLKIIGATKSKGAWDILKEEFKGPDKMVSIKL